MYYKVVVSIPIHENLEVAIDQIRNLKKYILGVGIIVHISEKYNAQIKHCEKMEQIEDVYINKRHINTDEKGIIYAHISNYYFARQYSEFDYFIMHASNDMYIKRGIIDYLDSYEAGFNIHIITCKSQWGPGNYALKDRQLSFILNKYNITSIVGTQIEGSFYRAELFHKIVKIIEESLTYEDTLLKYPREEIYFSTIAYHFVKNEKIGYPTTFSEVHRYDRRLWVLRYLTWGIYHRLKIYKVIPLRVYKKFEIWYSTVLFHSKRYKINPYIVRQLLNSNSRFLQKNSYLNDGRHKYRLYGKEIFSVKRVERKIQDPLRQYINNME